MAGKAFDVGEYRRTVLSKLKDDSSLADPDSGDVLWVCAVDSGATPAQAAARLDEVVAAWQKDRNHPKYKGVVAELVKNRDAYARVLADPSARTAAAARRESERAARFATALQELENLSKELVKKRGGIPADRIPALRAIAEQEGMDAETFTHWLSSKTVLEQERGTGAVPWEPMVRKQVRASLAELARLQADAAARTTTLLTFLGVGPGATADQVRAAHVRLSEANLRRSRDRAMTVTSDLLAHVSKRMFTDAGVESYVASLHADALEEIRGPLRRAAIVSGSVDASDFQALVMTVVGLQWGIGQHAARDIVTEAANALGVPVEVSTDTSVVVCGSCGRPQSPGRKRNCQYCNQPLFTSCPQCQAKVESATQVCPQCGCNLVLQAAAQKATVRARELLDGAHPSEALQVGRDAIGGADVADAPPELRAILTEAERSISQAGDRWRELRRAVGAVQPWHAQLPLAWLERNAADVPDPETGKSVAETRDHVAALKQQIEQQVADALAGPADALEAALMTLNARFPESPPVQAELRKLPLPAPRDVQAVLDGSSVELSWVAPPVRGTSYRVERHVVHPEDHRSAHVVGTTSSTSLEDAGIPIGVAARYTVTALSDGRTSPAATSPAPGVFLDGDIDTVALEVVNGDVVLTWPAAQLGAARVVVEREVDPTAGIKAPLRRLIPTEPGRLIDDKVDLGVPYSYRVALRYNQPDGTVVNTPGRTVTVTVTPPPQPVRELWSSGTDGAGASTISFPTVTAGEVTLYADGTGWPAAGTELSTADLEHLSATNGARTVGTGRRRVVDHAGRGRVRYQAVTVSGQRAVVGAHLDYLAIAKPSNARVVRDTGSEVTVTFDLPAGITEAFVAWQRDGEFPRTADTPAHDGAGSTRITNTKLDIDGGVTIPAPPDGRGLNVAVFSAVRLDGQPRPSTAGVSLTAREPRTIEVDYTVEVTGLLRKRVEVTAHTRDNGPLPHLRVIASAGGDQRTVAEYTGSASTAKLEAPHDPFGGDRAWDLEVVADPTPGMSVNVNHWPAAERHITP